MQLHPPTNMQNFSPFESCDVFKALYQPWTKPKLTFAPPALQAWVTAARWTGWTPTGRSSGCGSAWWKTQRCLRSALWCCDPACANTTHEAGGGLRTERMRGVPGKGKEYEDVRSWEIKQNTEKDASGDWPSSFFVPLTSCPDPSSYPTSHALRSSTYGPSEASSLSQALLLTVLCGKKKLLYVLYVPNKHTAWRLMWFVFVSVTHAPDFMSVCGRSWKASAADQECGDINVPPSSQQS